MKGAYKWLVQRDRKGAIAKFTKGKGWCVEVNGTAISGYFWSPRTAWGDAYFRPIREQEGLVG